MQSKRNGVPREPSPAASPAVPMPRVATSVPPTQVDERPKRRTFTAEYKLEILKQADEAEHGQIGALLRRENLYSSHLSTWRDEQETGALAALGKKRGRKSTKNPLQDENDKLRRQNAQLQARLAQAEVIIDVQKKVAGLLGIPLNAPSLAESDS